MARLGDLERAVMNVLWTWGPEPMTARAISDHLPADRERAYTTVLTVLDRLGRKGVVRREREGRAFCYVAAASREEFVAEAMLEALDTTDDRRSALMRFMGSVSQDDAEMLREIVENGR